MGIIFFVWMFYKVGMWINEIRNMKVYEWSINLRGIDEFELKFNFLCWLFLLFIGFGLLWFNVFIGLIIIIGKFCCYVVLGILVLVYDLLVYDVLLYSVFIEYEDIR